MPSAPVCGTDMAGDVERGLLELSQEWRRSYEGDEEEAGE